MKRNQLRKILIFIVSCFCICAMHHVKSEEYYTVYSSNNNPNESFKAMIGKIENAQFHNETYLSVVFYDTETKRYGFIDKNSNTYHPAIYYRIYDLFCRDASSPMLVETEPDCYVYIDRITGKVALNGQYRLFGEKSEFRNGFALIFILTENTDYPSLIDIDGNITSFPDSIIPAGSVQDNGLLIVCTIDEYGDALYGICRSSGEIVLEPQFDCIAEYHNGFASVRLNDLWGHIDENGIICTYPCYGLSEEYENGYTFNDNGIATFELLNGETITLSPCDNMLAQSDHMSEGDNVFAYPEEKEDAEFFIPEGNTSVDISIFYNKYLEILHVPSSCSTLMYYGYSDSSLRWIDVDENNTVYSSFDGILYSKNGETLLFCPPAYEQDEVDLPSTVTTIESGSFENTKNIKILIIPDTVKSIEGFAFENSSIETIIIYGTTTGFAIDAFNYCPNLKEIWIYQQSIANEILTEDIDYINLKDEICYIHD